MAHIRLTSGSEQYLPYRWLLIEPLSLELLECDRERDHRERDRWRWVSVANLVAQLAFECLRTDTTKTIMEKAKGTG